EGAARGAAGREAGRVGERRGQGGDSGCSERTRRKRRGIPTLPAGTVLRGSLHAGGDGQGNRVLPAGAGARSGVRASVGRAVALLRQSSRKLLAVTHQRRLCQSAK